jgi:hypothetical protein
MLKEEIACSFQTFDLESPPHFVALSYTWGDAEDVAFSAAGDTVLPPVPLIRVNKEKFAVTRNLFDALIALRKQKLRSCIWIDALCINQDDTNERNAQVSVMDQIYQSASQVLVWLGPDVRDDARKVQQLMRKLARWHDEVRFDEVLEAQIGGTVFTAIEVVHNASLPRFGAEDLLDWTCFVRFFRRRWFFRTWTVQELAAGRHFRSDITKCCSILGNTALGTTLGSTFLQDHLQRSHATGCFQKGAPIPGTRLTSALSLYWECRQNPSGHFEVPEELRRWCFRISGQATSTQNISALLSWFLYATWEQQASDPRDKVYGILGMVSAAARLQSLRVPTIEVDYSKPVESVFLEVAAFVLGKTNCLSYLAFVQDPSGRTLPQLPSWVPNFDYNSRISSLLFEDSE